MIFKKATKSICAIISSVMIINCVNVAGQQNRLKIAGKFIMT